MSSLQSGIPFPSSFCNQSLAPLRTSALEAFVPSLQGGSERAA